MAPTTGNSASTWDARSSSMLRATSRFASQRMRNASYVPMTLGTSTAFGRPLNRMTRQDLAFAFSELSKFVQAPGPVHWKSATHTLQYLCGTYDKGITYSDPGPERRDCIEGW
eukprot:1597653-Rhodomonas_salina.1